jgi:hypothetical protein
MDRRTRTLKTKARYLTIGVLLITFSMAALHVPLQAQEATEPAVTEDDCTAIIEAGMLPQDDTALATPEDSALESCLESLSITELDTASMSISATPEAAAPDATETVSPAVGYVYIPITVIHSNAFADAGRVWVIWHDATTDALTVALLSYNERISYYNMGLDITIPDDVVNIAVRIETTQDRSSGNWEFDPTCAFAFTEPPQAFSVTVDDDNVCTGQIDGS